VAVPRGSVAAAALLVVTALTWVVVFVAPPASAATPATIVTHGSRELPRVALTFDDNYYPSRTLSILDTLRRYDAPATLFLTGVYVTAYPQVNTAIVQGGLEVGDHSMTHPFLTKLSWDGMLYEIGGGTRLFTEQTGAPVSLLMRPPYGHVNSAVAEAAGVKGFRYVVLWDVGVEDWTGYSADAIRDHVLNNARNGSIVLLHFAAPHTWEALPEIIVGLRARGFELVTVSELLKGGRRFLDVTNGSPVDKAAERLVEQGYMSGYNESYFGPADPMTRAQFAKVAALVAGIHTPEVENASSPTFADVPVLHDAQGNPLTYPFDYIEEAADAGIIRGSEYGTEFRFRPGDRITRVQLAQIVARLARNSKGYPEAPPGAGASFFIDAPAYAGADLALVSSLGLLTGYTDSRFDPWATASRGHVALVMNRYLDLPVYSAPPPPTTTTTVPSTTTTAAPSTTTTTVPPTTTTTLPVIHPPTTTTTTPVT